MLQIHVLMDGNQHISGSPYLMNIQSNTIHPSFSLIYGEGLSFSEAGISSKFYVQTRDVRDRDGGEEEARKS